MRKSYFCFGLLYLLTSYTPLASQIVEAKNFSEILQFSSPEALIILDIDDTLLIPAQTLGVDAWFSYLLKKYQTELNPEQALDKALSEWEAVRHITKMKIVEDGTDNIVQHMQNENMVVMGLTTQGLALATRTVQQLKTANIDLSVTAPSDDDQYFVNGHGVLYRKGILFTSGTSKGEALFTLLDNIGFHPNKIVFINDKATHLNDVEQSAQSRGIEFIGLRYSYGDLRVENFRPEIADIQWQYSTFNHIISDAEAEMLLTPDLAYPRGAN